GFEYPPGYELPNRRTRSNTGHARHPPAQSTGPPERTRRESPGQRRRRSHSHRARPPGSDHNPHGAGSSRRTAQNVGHSQRARRPSEPGPSRRYQQPSSQRPRPSDLIHRPPGSDGRRRRSSSQRAGPSGSHNRHGIGSSRQTPTGSAVVRQGSSRGQAARVPANNRVPGQHPSVPLYITPNVPRYASGDWLREHLRRTQNQSAPARRRSAAPAREPRNPAPVPAQDTTSSHTPATVQQQPRFCVECFAVDCVRHCLRNSLGNSVVPSYRSLRSQNVVGNTPVIHDEIH
ncbi:hypothetical protein HDK64DRAFT_338096, partial [Phyllosticta capitalensis]